MKIIDGGTLRQIVIDGVTYPLVDEITNFSDVRVSNTLSNGVLLGTLLIGDKSYSIYAPNDSSSSEGLEVDIVNTTLSLVNDT